MDVQEVRKLDAYLKKLFGNARVRVVPRPKKDDSAEVYVGDEFIGVLFVDDEDDERSFTSRWRSWRTTWSIRGDVIASDTKRSRNRRERRYCFVQCSSRTSEVTPLARATAPSICRSHPPLHANSKASSRKTKRQVRAVDAAFAEAHAGRGGVAAASCGHGRRGNENKSSCRTACRRESAHRQAVLSGGTTRRDSAVNGAHAHVRRQRVVMGGIDRKMRSIGWMAPRRRRRRALARPPRRATGRRS